MGRSSSPIHQVLQLLHGLRLAVTAAGEDLPAVIHTDDAVGRVDEKTAGNRISERLRTAFQVSSAICPTLITNIQE